MTSVAPPVPEGELAKRIDFHRQRLASAGSLDGDKQLCQRLTDGGLDVFTSSYSATVALNEFAAEQRYEESNCFALGPIGVNLLLENAEGKTLWGKRAAGSYGAGSWHVVPSGMYEPVVSPRRLLLAEAHEELGLSADKFSLLEPLLITYRPDLSYVQIVYRGVLLPGADLRVNQIEHNEVVWAHTPDEVEPLLPQGRAIWQARQHVLGLF